MAELKGSVDGGIDPSHGAFFIEGNASVTVVGYKVAAVDVIGSNIGPLKWKPPMIAAIFGSPVSFCA